MSVSRRDFLTKAGVGALGVAAVGALAGCSGNSGSTSSKASASQATNGLETKYDVDVLVVGSGLAGFCAAVHTLDLGVDPKKVLLIDKMSGKGMDYAGSSMVTGGNYLLPTNNSDEGKKAYSDAIYAVSREAGNYSLISVMGEYSSSVLDWMIANGCVYGDVKDYSKYDAVCQRTMESASPAHLRETFESKDGQMAWETKAVSLNVDASGICGVVALDKDGYFNIAAKKTILCTGGFLGSADLMETLIGENGGRVVSRTTSSITGDGIGMVKEVGGCMAPNSHGVKAIYLTCTSIDNLGSGHATRALPYTITVNGNAKRFYDESLTTDSQAQQDFMRTLLEQPGCKTHMLADSKAAESLKPAFTRYDEIGVPYYECASIDEAADLFGIDASALKATVDEYNAHVVGDHTEGLATEKTSLALTIDTPPFYAFPSYMLTSSLTYSGIAADEKGRVICADGTIVPNLYAAGELVGGFFYDEYFGGTQQCKAAVFGYLSAEDAVGNL